jgi:FkbM family methyltransferase
MGHRERELSNIIAALRGLWPTDTFCLCDVGAGGGLLDQWSPLRPFLRTLGFEPNPVEFAKLSARSEDKFVNAAAAGSDGEGLLHVTKFWTNSSLLRPNQEILRNFDWSDAHEIVKSVPVRCLSLDSASAVQALAIDFLKVDTQGTELDILKGARVQLAESVVCVELEVEFCELYQDQALFADVDIFMRSRGFYLHELGNILSVKAKGKSGLGGPKGRVVSADALYFRRSDAKTLSVRQQRALALAYLAYGYSEEALQQVENLEGNESSPETVKVRRMLQQFRPFPHWIQRIPGWRLICRIGKRLWYQGMPAANSQWDRPLGN